MALLWRHHRQASAKPARGRRPKLSIDEIVRAAIVIADAEGLEKMSMHRVARAVGAGTMSLYTYVPGKAELLDLMVDAVLLELDLPAPDEPRDEGWREQVWRYAERTRTVSRSHPWLAHVSLTRPPLGPGVFATHEYLLSALRAAGLRARRGVDAALAVTVFVGATARQEAESDQATDATGMSYDQWWQARAPFWGENVDVTRYPATVATAADGGYERAHADTVGDAFAFGLTALLDGIEAEGRAAHVDRAE